MQRLLIVDSTAVLGKALTTQLKDEYVVSVCDSGENALKQFRSFAPDIVVLDLQLTDMSGLSALHALRTADPALKIIVTTNLADTYTCRELERQQVDHAFQKPCSLGTVIACIRDISKKQNDRWCVENETDRILLEIGFRFNGLGYYCTHAAVLGKLREPFASVTKCIYPQIGKTVDGTGMQVEKAIRDAIKYAWTNGNKQLWQVYFPGAVKCPSNEQFLARIANVLQQKIRLKQLQLNETEMAI